MSNYKRILTIQDISCFGQCSLTVALPIISACGIETAVLPSAVLSTHTGGFTGFTFRDLTDDMPDICRHWVKEGISFDAIYTGYLGSKKQIDIVREIVRTTLRQGGLFICDPAMGDNGRLYTGFTDEYALEMAGLCAEADIVLPNITEACFMTGCEYKENYDEDYVLSLFKAMEKKGMKTVVMTGVGYDNGHTGVAVYRNGKCEYYCHRKISSGSHGTGDVYASAFCGALMQGKEIFEASKIAADYTLECIEKTVGDESHRYGVKFETALPSLIKSLGL